MQPPPPLVPLLAGAFVVHFPRLRMYQPSWPYSSASCRLSCSIRHVGIAAGAFHVCRPPAVPSHRPVRDLVPRLHRPPAPAQSLFAKHKSVPPNPASCRIRSPVCGRAAHSLVERPAGMPLDHPAAFAAFNRQNRWSQRPLPARRGAPGASSADWMILRSGAAPLQGTNNHRCLVRQSCRRSF